MRVWHKCIPPKICHEMLGVYKGIWMPQMDRYWESDDGISVMSRQIKTEWGKVEHITIHRMNGDRRDVPWSLKQEIKDELYGDRRIAIEVFPDKKSLVDVCDVYHLWLLPKDMRLPFGIHPYRDPQGAPVERGYDYNLEEVRRWTESEERAELCPGEGIVCLE